jgi:hypothetical protein
MARNLTTAYKNEATASTCRPFLLFQAIFDSGAIRFWNGTGDLSYGGNTYTGAGHLLSMSSIDETTKVESRGIMLKLSGIPLALISIALAEDYQDRQVTVDVGFFDSTGAIVVDPFRFFSGKADVMEIQDGGDTATISLAAENDIIILQRANERRRTHEDQKLESATDTFFKNVTSLQNQQIVWGGSK